jgi:polyphosphate kinase
VYYFHNDGTPELYLASADWMERNFFHRIEVAFPVQEARYQARIVQDLEFYLNDNCQSWQLQSDGKYIKASPEGHPLQCAQEILLNRIVKRSE